MKKQTLELDFIGGQGSLTKEEEIALSKFFAKKNSKLNKKIELTSSEKKSQQLQHS
jgi:hypothetical protein